MKTGDSTRRGKSKYAKKIARKTGRGTIGADWMWWTMPRRPEVHVPPYVIS
jgi:hypothetical protein